MRRSDSIRCRRSSTCASRPGSASSPSSRCSSSRGEVAHLGERAVEPLGERRELGVERGQRRERARGLGELIARTRGERVAGIAGEARQRCAALAADAIDVREPRAQREQRLELAGRELRLVDLAHLEDQEVPALLAVARRRAQRFELGRDLTLTSDLVRDPRARRAEPGPAIEQLRMARGVQQRLRVVLARDLDPPREQLAERRDRRLLARHPGAAAPALRERAAHDQLVLVAGEAALGELALELGQRIGAEHRLDDRLLGAVAHRARGGAATREQRERAEHDRLARAGLARQHVEARRELERRRLHDRELLDAQRLDQRSPQRSFSRMTANGLRCGDTSSRAGCAERATVTRSPCSSAMPTWPSTVKCTSPPRVSSTRISIR